jgi:hypothetical protein
MLLSLHTQFNYDGNKSKLETMGKLIEFGWYGEPAVTTQLWICCRTRMGESPQSRSLKTIA